MLFSILYFKQRISYQFYQEKIDYPSHYERYSISNVCFASVAIAIRPMACELKNLGEIIGELLGHLLSENQQPKMKDMTKLRLRETLSSLLSIQDVPTVAAMR